MYSPLHLLMHCAFFMMIARMKQFLQSGILGFIFGASSIMAQRVVSNQET